MTIAPRAVCFRGAVRHKSRAFTLLEVLVVVAIILLLVSVLLQALTAARVQSRRAVCLSNLKQLSTGWQMYLGTTGGNFPPQKANGEINWGGRQGSGSRAFGSSKASPVLKPLNPQFGLPLAYYGTPDIFRCPCDPGSADASPTYFESHGTSYRANVLLAGRSLSACTNFPVPSVCTEMKPRLVRLNRSQIDDESRLLLLGDFEWYRDGFENLEVRPAWHGAKCSYCFAYLDGHARFERLHRRILSRPHYTIVPFGDLRKLGSDLQKDVPEVPCD